MKRFRRLSIIKKILVIVIVLIVICVWSFAGFLLGKKFAAAKEEKPTAVVSVKEDIVPQIADYQNPINGVLYTQKEATSWKDRVPLAIMVENSTVARPQSGLSRADIVYEALAEGGITRFVAIFLSQSSQVGPVRSAREYYYDWILEYKVAYAHWGGNEYVRKLASQTFGTKDLDQFVVGAAAYYRLCDGEHCGYTSTDKLWAVATQRGVNKPVQIDSWQFKDDAPVAKPSVSEITLGFQGDPGYVVVWKYDAVTNTYKRSNGGAPHIDKENGQQIAAKTVIVEYLTDLGYKQVTCCPPVSNRVFQTVGSGKAKIFLDGVVLDATWKKDSSGSRTKFFDSTGKEIALNRGQIWMEMVPGGSAVSWK